jgi:hypothetical protein
MPIRLSWPFAVPVRPLAYRGSLSADVPSNLKWPCSVRALCSN